MPFVTFTLSKDNETINYDLLTEYPPEITKKIYEGYTVKKIVPDDQK